MISAPLSEQKDEDTHRLNKDEDTHRLNIAWLISDKYQGRCPISR